MLVSLCLTLLFYFCLHKKYLYQWPHSISGSLGPCRWGWFNKSYRTFTTYLRLLLLIINPWAGLNCYWPHRTSSTWDLLILQIFYWSYIFFFNIKKRLCMKSTDNIYFYLFNLHLLQKYLAHS